MSTPLASVKKLSHRIKINKKLVKHSSVIFQYSGVMDVRMCEYIVILFRGVNNFETYIIMEYAAYFYFIVIFYH